MFYFVVGLKIPYILIPISIIIKTSAPITSDDYPPAL